jgi:uncharacterized protein YdaU (DUF1376 family)
MSKFYRMDPWAWDDGTTGLSLEQEAAYLRIVNATNKSDEPIMANRFALAGMFRCNTEKAMRLLRDLEAAGKVQLVEGRIHNKRADQEIEYRRTLSATRAQAASNRKPTDTEPAPNPSATGEQPTANPPATDDAKPLQSLNGQAAIPRLIEENRIEEEKKKNKKGNTARGTRLPDDWWPQDTDWQWAKDTFRLDDNQLRELTADFKDYWPTVPGARGRKLDWFRTWRCRVRDRFGINGRSNRNGQARRQPPQNTIAEGFAEINAALDQRLADEQGQTGDSPGGEIAELVPRLRQGS